MIFEVYSSGCVMPKRPFADGLNVPKNVPKDGQRTARNLSPAAKLVVGIRSCPTYQTGTPCPIRCGAALQVLEGFLFFFFQVFGPPSPPLFPLVFDGLEQGLMGHLLVPLIDQFVEYKTLILWVRSMIFRTWIVTWNPDPSET